MYSVFPFSLIDLPADTVHDVVNGLTGAHSLSLDQRAERCTVIIWEVSHTRAFVMCHTLEAVAVSGMVWYGIERKI